MTNEQMFQELKVSLNGINERLDGIDERLDGIDERLDGIDERLDGIDERLDGHDERFDGIDAKLNTIIAKQLEHDEHFVSIETRLVKYDSHEERINILERKVWWDK